MDRFKGLAGKAGRSGHREFDRTEKRVTIDHPVSFPPKGGGQGGVPRTASPQAGGDP